jgi:UDP-N-acetyl-D-galactosamine dehydrogenase
VHDPLADSALVLKDYAVAQSDLAEFRDMDALILAVPHRAYLDLGPRRLAEMLTSGGIFLDVKARLPLSDFAEPRAYWSL